MKQAEMGVCSRGFSVVGPTLTLEEAFEKQVNQNPALLKTFGALTQLLNDKM